MPRPRTPTSAPKRIRKPKTRNIIVIFYSDRTYQLFINDGCLSLCADTMHNVADLFVTNNPVEADIVIDHYKATGELDRFTDARF